MNCIMYSVDVRGEERGERERGRGRERERERGRERKKGKNLELHHNIPPYIHTSVSKSLHTVQSTMPNLLPLLQLAS